jgi:uncharacterized membrane protein YphA (DoxX/SURF4 family)
MHTLLHFDTEAIGILIVRITTGILFFFQGYDKVFRVGIKKVVETIAEPLKKAPFPDRWLLPMIALSSYIEITGGILLFSGLLGDLPLALLAADLVMVAFAFSATTAMWDMQYYFPRFAMVITLFMLPSNADHFRMDIVLGW